MRVSDVAACQGMDVSSVTPRIEVLKRAGLITRGPDPADRRASVVSLEAAGRAALERAHTAWCDILEGAVWTGGKRDCGDHHLVDADSRGTSAVSLISRVDLKRIFLLQEIYGGNASRTPFSAIHVAAAN